MIDSTGRLMIQDYARPSDRPLKKDNVDYIKHVYSLTREMLSIVGERKQTRACVVLKP